MNKLSVNPVRRRTAVPFQEDIDVREIDFPSQIGLRHDISQPKGGSQSDSFNPFALSGYDNPVAPLTRFLGSALTTASDVWSPDAVERMRALQKKLIEHSLKLAQQDRMECMGAITIVESAIQLRLRVEQMRKSELEGLEENSHTEPT